MDRRAGQCEKGDDTGAGVADGRGEGAAAVRRLGQLPVVLLGCDRAEDMPELR